jgi:4-amino-4-deoxy-L-arabinose transferase-like glycosyltransferase
VGGLVRHRHLPLTPEPEPDTERGGPRHAPRPDVRRRKYRKRRIVAGILLVLGVFIIWLAFSLGDALLNPANGSSLTTRFAEWTRQHEGGFFANWIEKEYYSHHQPATGGKPPAGSIKKVTGSTSVTNGGPPHLTPPVALKPLATPVIAGEGQWSPAGRLIGGIPAIYETRMRPDSTHTSEVVGVA